MNSESLYKQIIKRTLKVPKLVSSFDGNEITSDRFARQLDVASISLGFKLSGELLDYIGKLRNIDANEVCAAVADVLKEATGAHVKHNSYFIDFPFNVPDTMEFWIECINKALSSETAELISAQLEAGFVNLLDLPTYGSYQHTYEELVGAHSKFVPLMKRDLKVISLGNTLHEEGMALYSSLLQSNIPLNEDDLKLLKELATVYIDEPQPEKIAMRENKAIINAVRLNLARRLANVDTVTDVLRTACAVSDGDVTLLTKTKFKAFARRERRLLLSAIGDVMRSSVDKSSDANKHIEQWKRLGERLKPHEFNDNLVKAFFGIVRGQASVKSDEGRIEEAFLNKNFVTVVDIMKHKPGLFVRSVDRLLRSEADIDVVVSGLKDAIPRVSSRVLLSLREHIQNRLRDSKDAPRVFANRKGTVYTVQDTRKVLDRSAVVAISKTIDAEVAKRIPENIVFDESVLNIAIPLSGKNTDNGIGVLPRGSISDVSSSLVRFFCYWKESRQRTDYDLSAIILNEKFEMVTQLSYTQLRAVGGTHSGDITSSMDGATEFIDIDLKLVQGKYVIPQVNIFAGESFADTEECFFGFMERELSESGLPFEPSTVKNKSDIKDKGRVSLPLVFVKDDEGNWTVKWLHIFLNGHPQFNATENNRNSTKTVVKSIVQREYLTLDYLNKLSSHLPVDVTKESILVTMSTPTETLENTKLITPLNIHEVIT